MPTFSKHIVNGVEYLASDKESRLNLLGENQAPIFAGNIVQGSYVTSTHTNKAVPNISGTSYTTRVRMANPIFVGTGVTVVCKSVSGDYYVNYVEFDSDCGYDGALNSTWGASVKFVTTKPYILLMFRKKDNGTYSVSDFDPDEFVFYTSGRNIAEKNDLALDENKYNILDEKRLYTGNYISSTYELTYFGVMRAMSYGPFAVTAGTTYRFEIDYDENIGAAGFVWYNASNEPITRNNHYPFSGNFEHVAPTGATKLVLCILLGPLTGTTTEYGSPNSEYLRSHHAKITESQYAGMPYMPYKGSAIDWVARDMIGKGTGTKFAGKVLSVLGDSISTYAGEDAESAGHSSHLIADGTWTYAGNCCRYPNSVVTNPHEIYWVKLMDALGFTLGINDSWAGSRVSWNGSEGSDIGADKYIASPTRIGHLDENGTPDYILVNAGTNDIGNSVTIGTFNTENPVNYTDEQIAALPVATFADAYRALLIRLQKAYPLAKIVVLLPNYTTSYYNPTEADGYLEVIKEACDYFGVPWIDMRACGVTMYNTGTYMSDGVHPNVSGMQLMADKVIKAFQYSIT